MALCEKALVARLFFDFEVFSAKRAAPVVFQVAMRVIPAGFPRLPSAVQCQ